ncbi:phage tail tip lysozyme [Pseudomonas sp. GD03746]|uniref:phage tail tip lysozyme n=1 Tax=Pseudomonas sp. GD03746 TaxID=2975378 RepID=UPI0024499608|nr:phage tail tip lysozyme [Pseudomonas sp. GD03746]MDH1575522.1 phage tail tip lysozyme [Pseudomonas sp. GD03746]
MKVLESFLIALGIKVDEKSFQKADAAFGGLTKSALQFGAVLASKLAIDKVVGDFKAAGTELDNFNRLTGLSTQNVQALGQALAAQGGNAQDAFAAMQKVQDLMASPITGNVGWFGDVAKLGLDPDAIIGAQDTAEALANIAGSFEKMTPLNQRLAGQALGFDENTIRLLMKGRDAVEQQLDSRSKLGIMTQKQVEDAARLTKANSELNLVFTDMGNTIAGELVPAFAELAEDFTAFYRDNKDLVDSGLEAFFGTMAKNIELVSAALVLMGGASALKGLAALRALVGLGGGGPAGGPSGGNPPQGGKSGGGGLPFFVNPLTAGLAALFYSSSLNEGEEEELRSNRLLNGGSEGAQAVVDFFRAKGWTEDQAKGIAANIEQESGFRADAEGDGGKAYGLAQWHPDRQANFAKFSGKDIRQSTAQEQLEFIHHELTRGLEKSAGDRLRMAGSAREAAGIVSQYYERPTDTDGEINRRGAIAESYGGTPQPESTAPVVDLRDPEQWTKVQAELAKSGRQGPGILEQIEAWAKTQRRSPEPYTASDVVTAPAPSDEVTAPAGSGQSQPIQHNDNRQFHIHGADTEKVKQLYNEQLSTLINQTTQDFRSPEK